MDHSDPEEPLAATEKRRQTPLDYFVFIAFLFIFFGGTIAAGRSGWLGSLFYAAAYGLVVGGLYSLLNIRWPVSLAATSMLSAICSMPFGALFGLLLGAKLAGIVGAGVGTAVAIMLFNGSLDDFIVARLGESRWENIKNQSMILLGTLILGFTIGNLYDQTQLGLIIGFAAGILIMAVYEIINSRRTAK